jgi:ribosomal protein S18 acetylase RimI-like enzyme
MKNHDLVIRQAQETDCEDLGRFFEQNNRPEVTRYFHPFQLCRLSAYLIACTEHLDKYYVAIKGERIIGLCMLRGWDEGFNIPSFGVLVDFRFQGVALGKKMTEFSVAEAKQIGCPAIRLSVYASNIRGKRLYENLGFTEISREPVSVGWEQDVKVVMIKEFKA